MLLELQQELKDDGVVVSFFELRGLFDVLRRPVHGKPTKGGPKLQGQSVKPIRTMIEENPSFSYRIVAHLLDMNEKTVQRLFQIMCWQVRKRPVELRPRTQAVPSVGHQFERAMGH